MSGGAVSDPTFRAVCIHAGDDGRSRLTDLDLPGMSRTVRADGTSTFGGVMGATVFGVVTPMRGGPTFIDWHVSAMAGLSIVMDGEWEIEAGSGDRRLLGPGSVLLMLDVTGQGHRAHYRRLGTSIGVGISAETEAIYRAILATALEG